MNYLAHFSLAGDNPGLIVGALMGDFVKGPLSGRLPPDIERGIRLHRRIDALTDDYIRSASLHRLFPSRYRRFVPILLELYFDRVLIEQWSHWHSLPLVEFNQRTLVLLAERQDLFSKDCHIMYRRLRDHSLLERYAEPETLQRILQGINRRFALGDEHGDLTENLRILQREHATVAGHFDLLYRQLRRLNSAQ